MTNKRTYGFYKKSVKKAIKVFFELGGYQLTHIEQFRKYSNHRLVFSGVDLYELQERILALPDTCILAVSQYGTGEPYHRSDFEIGLVLLCERIQF